MNRLAVEFVNLPLLRLNLTWFTKLLGLRESPCLLCANLMVMCVCMCALKDILKIPNAHVWKHQCVDIKLRSVLNICCQQCVYWYSTGQVLANGVIQY